MAGPPFLPGGVPETEGFRRPGAPEKKICRGAPETLQGGASAGKLHADARKGRKMGMKMTEAGHGRRKYSLMPRRGTHFAG